MSVAAPGFPRGGCADLLFDNFFQNFSQKLHENEDILGERRGHASLAPPPPDPPVNVIRA